SPGAATRFAVTTPAAATAGMAITPAITVTVEDDFGNVVKNFTTPITIAIGNNPGGGTLSGTLTSNLFKGVAAFSDLSINKSGTGYTLSASADALTRASGAFNITAASASKIAFVQQPSNTAPGAPITPAVRVAIEDALGNVVTGATNAITVAIGTNPGGSTLS